MLMGIFDYGVGNLKSVKNAFEYVGASVILSSDLEELKKAQGFILPGVGSFYHCQNLLKKYKFKLRYMAKKITRKVKLQIPGGVATPAPPVGPALGSAGVNIGEFVSRFNDGTADRRGEIVPVEIQLHEDRTFDLVYKTSPASRLLLKALGKEKGSGHAPARKVGAVTEAQVREIAEQKTPDLSAGSLEAAILTIKGTARSMGIEVAG